MRGTGREVGGQRVFWEWERLHYLPTILAASLLGLESGFQHGVHGVYNIWEPATSASLSLQRNLTWGEEEGWRRYWNPGHNQGFLE